MQMLYDSDDFVVVHIDANEQLRQEALDYNEKLLDGRIQVLTSGLSFLETARRNSNLEKHKDWQHTIKPVPAERPCFEIVDKRTNKEILLCEDWARYFQQQIEAWHLVTPLQEEVEEVLDQITFFAQNPLVIH